MWTPTSIKFYVDGVLVSTHTGVVPQTPAFAMINHWGTNSTGWGGLATTNITRYMFVRSFSFIPLSQSTTNPPPPPSGNPAPTVSGVSPTSGTTAGGTPVTITGTGFLAGATVSLGGTAATGVTVVRSTSITATAPAHAAGAVNVVVTNTDSQSGTLPSGYTYTSSGGGGTITFVQAKSGTAKTGASLPVAYPVAQTAGNMNVVAVMWGDTTSTVSSVTDSQNNTYVLAVGPTTASGLSSALYYAANIIGGSNTVTVTFNTTAAWPNVNVMEYSGLSTSNPLDVTSAGTGAGTTANSGSATTTSASELIVGAGNPVSTFTAAGSGFTSRVINSFGGISEDKIVNATGSYNATATMTSGGWVMQMATFRAQTSGRNLAPTVSGVSPTSGTTAGGTPVTITGTGFLAGATVSLGGTAATGVTVVRSTSITAIAPAHAAGAVNVVVTNTDSQSGTLPSGYTYTSSGGGGTITFVQAKSGTARTGASLAVAYPVVQTAGNMNVVAVMWGDTTSTVSSVTDSQNNTYVLAVGPTTASGLSSALYYAANIIGGSNTVTVTFNTTAAWPNVNVMEYSGLSTSNPLDVTSAGTGAGTTANSGSVTTTSASELIVGAGNPVTTFTAAGSGFTSRVINSFGGSRKTRS